MQHGKMQFENCTAPKNATWNKINMKKVQHGRIASRNKCNLKKVQHKESATQK